MSEYNEILNKLKNIENILQKRMVFISLFSSLLKKQDTEIILVGGQAVAFYTLGTYLTEDIDIISYRSEIVEKVLKELKFEKIARVWYNEDFNIVIDIVGFSLSGSKDKLREIEIEGRIIKIIGVEDLIVERLCSYIYWKVEQDIFVAKQLLITQFDEIDWDYLEKKAKSENVIDQLIIVKEEIEKINNRR
ncbi:MAG: DUF6036 family nucleotidyltransferase [Candidatus Helarchaeota archaeon]